MPRGACKYCPVRLLAEPLSKGDPALGSEGYAAKRGWRSCDEALVKKFDAMYFSVSVSVLGMYADGVFIRFGN